MSENQIIVWTLFVLALVAANLPWISERVFFIIEPKRGEKSAWLRLLEWLVLYFVVGVLAAGMEYKLDGDIHPQDWEFYAVTACLFLVFAVPGFIYRYDLRKHLRKRRPKAGQA